MKDNRGLSLVELVAVMAIMAIISVALIGFMVLGMRHYQEADSEVSRQSEAQLASNQIQDILIDTTNGVNYIPSSHELWTYNVDVSGGTAEYTATKINWDTANSQLLLSKYKYTQQPSGSYLQTPDGENQLLAENVSNFAVDLSELTSKNSVSFDLTIRVRGKAYKTESNVKLRNEIREVASEAEAFNDINVVLTPVVDNVVVSPASATVWQGGSYAGFTAVVNGINYPAQEVAWSFADPTVLTDPSTMINASSGLVTLGENETCENIEVVATSLESKRAYPSDSSQWKSGSAMILNKRITGIRMEQPENTTDMSIQANVIVEGLNFEGNEDLSGNITFLITDENGNEVRDITTSVRAATQQTAGRQSKYVFRATAPASYSGRKITIQPTITYNGMAYTCGSVSVKFVERTIIGFSLQKQEADGTWTDCGNSAYTANRGETMNFRIKVAYGTTDSATVEYENYWTPQDPEWSEHLRWSVQKGGAEISSYGDVSKLASTGAFTVADFSAFNASSRYSFILKASYVNGNTSFEESLSISIPEVKMSVQERHDNQSKEFITNGENQNIHFVVSGVDASLYAISFVPLDDSVMQQSNVRVSGDLAILTPQKAGNGTMKFNLVDKNGRNIQSGSNDISVTLPLEVGNKNLYVRTGLFGSYDYTLSDGSMYVPLENYSSKGTVAYSLSGIKVTYKTKTSLFGTEKTVQLNDDVTYTRVSYNGENIWYR